MLARPDPSDSASRPLSVSAPPQTVNSHPKEVNMNHVPAYLWALTYVEVTGIAAATAYALYRGARAAGLGNRASTRTGLGAALLFGGWLAVSSLVAGGGSYRSRLGHGVPWLPLAVLGFFGLLLAL